MRKAWNHVINLKERVYAKKRKNILCLEKKRSEEVYLGADKKRIHSTV